MTPALALSLALLIAPSASRARLQTIELVAVRRRHVPLIPCAAVAATAGALLLPVATVIAAAALAATLVVRGRRRSAQRRRVQESRALQSALDVLVGELRVGAHPVSAFDTAATEVGGPVAESFRAVAARARLGADVAAGLRSIAEQSPTPSHWERLAVAWRLASEHGLAIAALMRSAQRDIVERESFSARVNAGMAGARATGAVLAGLPFLGIGLGQLIGADPVSFLLSGRSGGWLLDIGVALACCGLLWSDRITGQVLS